MNKVKRIALAVALTGAVIGIAAPAGASEVIDVNHRLRTARVTNMTSDNLVSAGYQAVELPGQSPQCQMRGDESGASHLHPDVPR
jgi:putative NIF3 family GTP cyclohydrolase 1 type 2